MSLRIAHAKIFLIISSTLDLASSSVDSFSNLTAQKPLKYSQVTHIIALVWRLNYLVRFSEEFFQFKPKFCVLLFFIIFFDGNDVNTSFSKINTIKPEVHKNVYIHLILLDEGRNIPSCCFWKATIIYVFMIGNVLNALCMQNCLKERKHSINFNCQIIIINQTKINR